jgi:hypothetical protein
VAPEHLDRACSLLGGGSAALWPAGRRVSGMGSSGRHEELAPTLSLAAAALQAEYGVKPIWFTACSNATEPPLNSMAQYLFELGQPAAALAWLETAMAGDTRRGDVLYAVRSSLHLAAILYALERHVAAMDVLEGTLRLLDTQQTKTTALSFFLPRAVAEHNMAVQQLVMDRALEAVETCERAIATVRAYVATMRSQHKSASSGSGSVVADLRLCSSQIECTWLAAARLCEQPKRMRTTSRLRDSRRSLLALAPLASGRSDARRRQSADQHGGRNGSPKTALEPPHRGRSPTKRLPTHYSKHRQRLAAVDSVVDSSRPGSFSRSGGNHSRDSVKEKRSAWVS